VDYPRKEETDMKRSGPVVLILLTLMAMLEPVGAQQRSDITFTGQIRPRFESRNPVDGSWDHFTSMRVRGNVAAALEGGINVFVQVQDVRFWGEETNTLGDFSADNLDLHQGYIEFGELPYVDGSLKVGRQEMAFAEQRLIGSVNWTQQGRSFDGIRLSTSLAGHTLDLFGMKLAENTAPTQTEDANLLGAYSRVSMRGSGTLDLFWLYNEAFAANSTKQSTIGAEWVNSYDRVYVRVEGAYQFGERDGSDVSAYMFGGRLGTSLVEQDLGVTLLYDYLSGDPDPSGGDAQVFSTLFATNHAFYGAADLFLDIPAHTGGHGLQDAAAQVSFNLRNDMRAGAEIHFFRAADQGTLSTARFGEEIDFSVTYRHSQAVSIVGGLSFVQAGEGLKEMGRLTENSQWTFLMANVTF
jgi:hypothetical protein